MKNKPSHQNTGYFIIHGEKFLCLFRTKPNGSFPHIAFKLRKSGKDGMFFEMESKVLEENSEYFEKFKMGEQVRI